MDINKIIDIVRTLKEDGMGVGAISGGPTNKTGAGVAGLPPDSPPVDLRRGRRRNWNPFFKDLARMQRRTPPQM